LHKGAFELLVLEPEKFGDDRGWFCESYSRERLAAAGFDRAFVQDNQSFSRRAGVVRGLHFQIPPHAQDKLVSVLRGRICDVAVDIRRGSPTYGQYAAYELSAENGRQLLVPVGFAHGFCTLAPDTQVFYKVSDYYRPDCERGLRWNDPELNIDWPVSEKLATLSDRDRQLPWLSEFDSPFRYETE